MLNKSNYCFSGNGRMYSQAGLAPQLFQYSKVLAVAILATRTVICSHPDYGLHHF